MIDYLDNDILNEIRASITRQLRDDLACSTQTYEGGNWNMGE